MQVLGRTEFKLLLKWRLQLRNALKSLIATTRAPGTDNESEGEDGTKAGVAAAGAGAGAADGEAGADADDPEAALMSEMASVKASMEKRCVRGGYEDSRACKQQTARQHVDDMGLADHASRQGQHVYSAAY